MRFKTVLFILIFFPVFSSAIFAQTSTYVLPYPSFMPGNIFYKPALVWEYVSKYFYFGNLGQFKYNLKESDKYLVQSKTLFEYSQFLYASNSLKKSDQFFLNTVNSLGKVQVEIKDSSFQKDLLKSAALKHIEVLEKTEAELPKTVNWSPEKEKPQVLDIRREIDKSISLRKKAL